jgi:hypothetical protein
MRHPTASRLLAAGAVLLLVSCTDDSGPAGPAGPSDVASLSAGAQGSPDDPLALGRAVPGFGGFFIDAAGAPTVYLKDPGRRAEAERALEPFFRARGLARGLLRVRKGDYDWAELERWFSQATPQVLGLAGAVFVDADEASNRVRIGVERGGQGAVRGALARLGVPDAAVIVEERQPVHFAAAPPKPKGASLQGQVRPIVGGVQINFPGYLCTLGFNIGGGSFITNSHCTSVQGGVENTPYYQPTSSTSPRIATELEDPAYGTGGGCPSGRVCRLSDASRAAYQSGFSQFAVGQIARTTRPGRSLTIVGNFTIRSEGSASVGTVVNKVGRTTGWSQGRVTNTCVNTNVSGTNVTQLCQSFVSATVGSGDSGSPVFAITSGTDVRLVGLLWGGSGASTFVFSPLSQVEAEIGAFSTF